MPKEVLGLRLLLLCSLLLFGLGTPRAEGSASGSGKTAEQYMEQAAALFKEQKFGEAGDKLVLANQANPHPVILFNAGQAYRKAMRPLDAKRAYQEFVTKYPSHALSPEAKGYIQTLEVLIAQTEEKKQVELALLEQKEKSEKELAEEREKREEAEMALGKLRRPFYKKAWFWVVVSGAVLVGTGIGLGVWGDSLKSRTVGGTQHMKFALTF